MRVPRAQWPRTAERRRPIALALGLRCYVNNSKWPLAPIRTNIQLSLSLRRHRVQFHQIHDQMLLVRADYIYLKFICADKLYGLIINECVIILE